MLLPDVLGQSLESIKRGELTVKLDLKNFEQLVRQLTRASHTLTAGIVLSGPDRRLVPHHPVGRRARSRSVTAGSAIAALLGVVLVWDILQTPK